MMMCFLTYVNPVINVYAAVFGISDSIIFTFFVDCGEITGASWFTQSDENGICHDWFDLEKGCYDSTCDGDTRTSLTTEASDYLASIGSARLSSELCSGTAPWPISSNSSQGLQVKIFCSRTCDYCPPTTTTPEGHTTTTTRTTTTAYASKQST